MSSLAQRQAALVAALVQGDPVPPGFDPVRVRATADALLRKRAGEVGERWPTLRAQFGPQWMEVFTSWASCRPPQGSVRDGWDFARHLASTGALSGPAAVDLAAAEATYVYDGASTPRRRHLPAARPVAGGLIIQVFGRLIRFGFRDLGQERVSGSPITRFSPRS